MSTITLESPFSTLPVLIAQHAIDRAEHPALIEDDQQMTYRQLDAEANRVAAALQRDGLKAGDAIAICGSNSINYAVLFVGALRAGLTVAPLAPSSSPESLLGMLADSASKLFFVDASVNKAIAGVRDRLSMPLLTLDNSGSERHFNDWLAEEGAQPVAVEITPEMTFNVIYSSGTTGEPKGIVQSHGMRWSHIQRGLTMGYGPDCRTLMSTPLYSNTTLVSFLPTIGLGGTVVIMAKFDAERYLKLAEEHRITHTMLVPVQYQRLLDDPAFDRFDLSSFKVKFSTSAPLRAPLIADAMARWPGNLREAYGLTAGGISTSLDCAAHPDKWDSVGKPTEGAEVRVIDEEGNELPRGETGEIVGRAISMMRGYINREEQTRDMLWTSPEGLVFYRSGDMGRVDEEGFVYILDRRKDMIISGGFNIYAVDLEKVLLAHPAVADVAVIGIPSEQWGETPLGLVVLKPGCTEDEAEILEWTNGQLGKAQRLTAIEFRPELPRSTIGKVLKRDLRAPYWP